MLTMIEYRSRSGGRSVASRGYAAAWDLLDAVYASRRLQLPFEGILPVGY
jgi:hypothetical protein